MHILGHFQAQHSLKKNMYLYLLPPLLPFHGQAVLITVTGISMRRRRGLSPGYCIMFRDLRSPRSLLLILTPWEKARGGKKTTSR